MRSVEATGKTVEEAKRKAARELNVPETDLEFEVLEIGSKGILGFLGGAPARVRATYYETKRHRMESPQGAGRISPVVDAEMQEAPARRPRRRRGSGSGNGGESSRNKPQQPAREASASDSSTGAPPRRQRPQSRTPKAPAAPEPEPQAAKEGSGSSRRRGRSGRSSARQDQKQQAPAPAQGAQEGATKPVEALNLQSRAQQATEIVQRIVDSASLGATAKITEIAEDGFQISIEGGDSSVLVGRQGQVLDALQFLVGIMINRKQDKKVRVTVEAANYRQKHRETLERTALELAAQVVEHNQEAELEPLPPRDRLVIHNALKEHPKVYTYSEGEGDKRHVVISPKSPDAQD